MIKCYSPAQDFLSRLTPFHLLNSRALGAGVARQSPSKSSEAMRQNMFGFNAGFRSTNEESSPGNTEASLFVGSYQSDGLLEMLLAHDQDMSTWISAEICICPSVKVIKDYIPHLWTRTPHKIVFQKPCPTNSRSASI